MAEIRAYNVKTKEKNVLVLDAVIKQTAKGGYLAQGHDGKGGKLAALMSKVKAEDAVKTGHAKWA